MSREEFIELLAAEQIEPRGEKRAELRTARVCAVMANAWRGKGQRALVPADFMPHFGPRPRLDRKSLRAKLLQFAHSRGVVGAPKE
jgi:hypothetical protein